MRIAVTGSREREPIPEEQAEFERLWDAWRGTVLLHGACPVPGPPVDYVTTMRGVDRWAHEWATKRGILIDPFPPLQKSIRWPRCGPERNRRMVATAGVLFALPGARGTENCIGFAVRQRIPVHRIGTADAWREQGYEARIYVGGIEQRLPGL